MLRSGQKCAIGMVEDIHLRVVVSRSDLKQSLQGHENVVAMSAFADRIASGRGSFLPSAKPFLATLDSHQ
jgi:hypothetical protein